MGTIESTTSEEKIQELLPGDRTTLLAIDGAPTLHVQRELGGMLDSPTHAVPSVGGNGAVREIEVLDRPSQTVPMPSRKRKVLSSFDYVSPYQTRPLGPPCDKA